MPALNGAKSILDQSSAHVRGKEQLNPPTEGKASFTWEQLPSGEQQLAVRRPGAPEPGGAGSGQDALPLTGCGDRGYVRDRDLRPGLPAAGGQGQLTPVMAESSNIRTIRFFS